MKGAIVVFGLLASSVSGHIQMSYPYPIRSPLNTNSTGPKDYSYTSPLSSSGSDFPCKGYTNDTFESVADYTPGETYEMTLEGSATHGGGSCQVSLSYDKGKTFKVIHSMLGGCPLTEKYNFKIPSDAPSGEALLAWTWFNKIGNREMYMNCAQVTIQGKSSKRSHPRDLARKLTPRSAFANLPPIFIANVNQEGGCKTLETEEVNFPLPGDSVEGSLSGTGYTCTGAAPFLDSSVSSSSSGSGSSSSAGPPSTSTSTSSSSSTGSGSSIAAAGAGSSTPTSNTSTATSAAQSSSAKPSKTPSSPAASKASNVSAPTGFRTSAIVSPAAPLPTTVTTQTNHATAAPTSGSSSNSGSGCTPGSIVCSSDGKSFSMCSNGSLVSMGSVAPGTICRSGVIIAT